MEDKKTRELLSWLQNELLSTKAKLTLAQIEKKRALEALRASKKQHKRGKKLMEEFRSRQSTGAIVFSPRKFKEFQELSESREATKEAAKEQ